MARQALISGINGQDGYYLGRLLLEKGYDVAGFGLEAKPKHEQMTRYEVCNIADEKAVDELLRKTKPDEIYNLAVFLSGEWKEKNLEKARQVNVDGVRHLLASMKAHAPRARLFQASTAYMFKPGPRPKNEDSEMMPANFHAQTKWEAHRMVAQAREEGLLACSGILFNHESPRRPPEFLMPKVCQAAAEFKFGRRTEKLELGDLTPVRDWAYAGDVVEAMWLMLQAGAPKDYVIATGKGHTVREVCEIAFSHVGLDWRGYIISQPGKMNNGADVSIGDASKLRRELGWKPKTTFKQLVHIMVDSAMEKKGASA